MLASPASQDETEINLATPDKGPTALTRVDKAVEPSNATSELHVFGSISYLASTSLIFFVASP